MVKLNITHLEKIFWKKKLSEYLSGFSVVIEKKKTKQIKMLLFIKNYVPENEKQYLKLKMCWEKII